MEKQWEAVQIHPYWKVEYTKLGILLSIGADMGRSYMRVLILSNLDACLWNDRKKKIETLHKTQQQKELFPLQKN